MVEKIIIPCREKIEAISNAQIRALERFTLLSSTAPSLLASQMALEAGLAASALLEKEISKLCTLSTPLISCPVPFGRPCLKADSEYNVSLREGLQNG